jgi:hypothetical protein
MGLPPESEHPSKAPTKNNMAEQRVPQPVDTAAGAVSRVAVPQFGRLRRSVRTESRADPHERGNFCIFTDLTLGRTDRPN